MKLLRFKHLAFVGSFDETSDVDNIQVGWSAAIVPLWRPSINKKNKKIIILIIIITNYNNTNNKNDDDHKEKEKEK